MSHLIIFALKTDLLEECPHPNADFTSSELNAARHSIAWQTADLQRRVYQTRIPPPGELHRVVTMVSDNINPGIRYYWHCENVRLFTESIKVYPPHGDAKDIAITKPFEIYIRDLQSWCNASLDNIMKRIVTQRYCPTRCRYIDDFITGKSRPVARNVFHKGEGQKSRKGHFITIPCTVMWCLV